MTNPVSVYGVYDLQLLRWNFFFRRAEALLHMNKERASFGPVRFPLEKAHEQFNADRHSSDEESVALEQFVLSLRRQD